MIDNVLPSLVMPFVPPWWDWLIMGLDRRWTARSVESAFDLVLSESCLVSHNHASAHVLLLPNPTFFSVAFI